MSILTKILVFIFTAVLLICLYFYVSNFFLKRSVQNLSQQKVCFGENCFLAEVAKTNLEHKKGLMFRNKLDQDKGMLFVFDKEDIYPFWMKNTLIPLDMVWIDANNKVVFISQNVQPCKSFICPQINPLVKAKYVLEVNAGTSQKINLKIGDEIKTLGN